MAEYGLEDSKTQLKRIGSLLPKNKPVELYQNLSALSIALVMGIESYLRKFDSGMALLVLMQVAEQYMPRSEHGDIQVLVFRAVSLILEHVPSSYDDAQSLHKEYVKLASTAAHKALCEEWQYVDADNKLLLEECLRVIRFIGRDDPTGSMLRYALVGDLLTLCSWEDVIMSRLALETLLTLSTKVVLPTEIEKAPTPISGIFSLFKSSSSKRKSQSSSRGGSNAAHRDTGSSLNADNPIVVIVENVLAPFLHSLVEQYVAMVPSVPEVWSMLELALQCLCGLMQRALLCCRAHTAHSLVSENLPDQVFRLIAYLDGNVSIEASTRAERLLLCETVLSVIMDCHRSLMLKVLLTDNARQFFHSVLEDSKEEITTLLDDPFPRGGMAARSTQRRDKDHITSIAAVRLLLLACPSVPPEAFGPKPKSVLPVHEWLWEDELRHANRLVEEQALVLETAFTRLSHTTSINVHRKPLAVDLQAMTMARGFQGGRRNIFRKFVPFVYHFADEQSLRPLHAVKETGPDALDSSSHSRTNRSRKEAGVHTLNKTVSVPADDLAFPEAYLDSICHFATHASGQMARQLAVCTCAALLQMFLLSGATARVREQLRKRMVRLCEMLREALVSADKATKAVALTMMEWLLRHELAEGCQFPVTALRCGLVEQLDALSKMTPVVAERDSRQTRTAYLAEKAGSLSQAIFDRLRLPNGSVMTGPGQAASEKGEGSASKRSSGGAAGRGKKGDVNNGSGSFSTPPVTLLPETNRLKQSVELLRSLGAQKGVHEAAIGQFFRALEASSSTTAYEFSQMGVAAGAMEFLYSGRTMDTVLGHSMVYTSTASGSTKVGRLSESAVGPGACPSVRFLEESPWTVMLTHGAHAAPLLRRSADAARLQCFIAEARGSPGALRQLVELLCSTLAQQADYPLVESIVTRERVVSRTPLQAVATLTAISPMVNLCGEDNGITNFDQRQRAFAAAANSGQPSEGHLDASSSPAGHAGHAEANTPDGTPARDGQAAASTQNSAAGAASAANSAELPGAKSARNYCLQGHPLQRLTHYARPCTCDYCFSPVSSGYCCRLCNIDICSRCYPRYRGNPTLIAAIALIEAAPKNRAHLMTSVGDIERFFRAGSSSTKGTFTAPTSQSSLHHIPRFIEKVRLSLQRLVHAVEDEMTTDTHRDSQHHQDPNALQGNTQQGSQAATTLTERFDQQEVAVAWALLTDEALLTRCVYDALSSYYTRGDLPGRESLSLPATDLSPEENSVAQRMIRDSLDERYLLYRDAVGYCHYQDTFLGLLYRKAFQEGNTEVLMQLENCLLRLEGSTEPISAPRTVSSPIASTTTAARARGDSGSSANASLSTPPVRGRLLGSTNANGNTGVDSPLGPTPTPTAAREFAGNHVSAQQSFVFHHFAHDGAEKCVCGRYDRNHFSTQHRSALSFSSPVIAQRTEMLLLILLHDALLQAGALRPSSGVATSASSSADKDSSQDGMESWFVSTAITSAVVKSLEASALRVSMLPFQFALPRWASFVLREAKFLIPRGVRERIARFVAYGARRSFITHMRIFRQYRDERQISVSYSEWARMSNHKFSIDRDYFVDDAFRVLCKASDARFPVSFEFKGDVGVGQGPTAQFYTRVARELSIASRALWRNTTLADGEEDSSAGALIVPPPEGLYPRAGALKEPPGSHPNPPHGEVRRGFLANVTDEGVGIISLFDTTVPVCDYVQRQRAVAKLFYLAGAAMGRAFLDEQVLPLQLSPALAYFLACGYPPSQMEMEQFLFTSVAPEAERPIDVYDLPMRAVRMVDASVADSLAALDSLDAESLASLELPFTMPGDDSHELIPNGASVLVDRTNLRQYQQRVITALLFDSVALPLRFWLRGCRDVLPGDALCLLDPSELMSVLCGDVRDVNTPLWTLPEIKSVLVGDHGYQNDSPQLDMLARVLADRLSPAEQRRFLLFCTGCPRLPLGGIRALGAITVVRRSNAFAHAQSLLAAQARLKETEEGNGEDDGATPPPPPEDDLNPEDGKHVAACGAGGGGRSDSASPARVTGTSKGEDGAIAGTESAALLAGVMRPSDAASGLSPEPDTPLPGSTRLTSEVDATSSLRTDLAPRRTNSNFSGRPVGSTGGGAGAGDDTHDPNQLSDADWALPSVNTCFRYLKLPPYPSEDLLYKKLVLSITQSGENFELS